MIRSPSGLKLTPLTSGLPNNTSRGISGTDSLARVLAKTGAVKTGAARPIGRARINSYRSDDLDKTLTIDQWSDCSKSGQNQSNSQIKPYESRLNLQRSELPVNSRSQQIWIRSMKSPWPDRLVILALVGTLLIVFALIFSLRPAGQGHEPSIQWREAPESNSGSLQI